MEDGSFLENSQPWNLPFCGVESASFCLKRVEKRTGQQKYDFRSLLIASARARQTLPFEPFVGNRRSNFFHHHQLIRVLPARAVGLTVHSLQLAKLEGGGYVGRWSLFLTGHRVSSTPQKTPSKSKVVLTVDVLRRSRTLKTARSSDCKPSASLCTLIHNRQLKMWGISKRVKTPR